MTKVILIVRVSDIEQRQALSAQKLRLIIMPKKSRVRLFSLSNLMKAPSKDNRQKFAQLIRRNKLLFLIRLTALPAMPYERKSVS